MKKINNYLILENKELSHNVFKMKLKGDSSWIHNPGQFINITIDNAYLKRPISICDYDDETLTIVYRVVGFGTKQMSTKKVNDTLECLVDLGNGFNTDIEDNRVLVIGGGIGIPPLYRLCKELINKGKEVIVILGYNSVQDSFLISDFMNLKCKVLIASADGSIGEKGFVSDVIEKENLKDMYYMTCGPMNMFKAIYQMMNSKGQLSFEERMGCGFGACMGCSCKTITGYKRICTEGPVMNSEDIIWTKD